MVPVKNSDFVNYELKFSASENACDDPNSPKTSIFNVKTGRLDQLLKVKVNIVCEFECSKNEQPKAPACMGRGSLSCGKCFCELGFTGNSCEAQKSVCHDRFCSGKGDLMKDNTCECKNGINAMVYGKCCECDESKVRLEVYGPKKSFYAQKKGPLGHLGTFSGEKSKFSKFAPFISKRAVDVRVAEATFVEETASVYVELGATSGCASIGLVWFANVTRATVDEIARVRSQKRFVWLVSLGKFAREMASVVVTLASVIPVSEGRFVNRWSWNAESGRNNVEKLRFKPKYGIFKFT